MKLAKILQLFAVFTLIGLAGPGGVFAQAETPQSAVQTLLATLQQMHHHTPLTGEQRQSNEKYSRQALAHLDVRQISEKALGKYWKQRSQGEQKDFVNLLGDLFRIVAFPSSGKFFGEMQISYSAVERDGKLATVPLAVLHAEEGEVGIDFVLEDQNSRWQVVDVLLDGVSLRNNLRLRFYKVIKKHDYAELIRRMQTKLKDAGE